MRKIIFLYALITLCGYTKSFGQLSDLAKIDYTNISRGSSPTEYNRIRVLFNYPIKLKKEGTYLFLGLDYSNINLILESSPSFVRDELNGFQLLDLNIGYTTPLRNDWRLGVRVSPGLSSNLKARDLSLEDIVLSSDVVFIKDKTKDDTQKKPWRLIVGVSYSGNRGFPFPLPFISYYKKLSPKWSYNLGIPKTNVQYHFSDRHRLKTFVQLDGFTSNLQRGVLIDQSDIAESINLSLIVGGLQYEYHISDHIEFYARGAYVLSDNLELRDENRDVVKDLGGSNSIYLRTGIRFKI